MGTAVELVVQLAFLHTDHEAGFADTTKSENTTPGMRKWYSILL